VLLAVNLVQQQALLVTEASARGTRGGGSFRPANNFNAGYLKKPENVFCVHCNKIVAHKADICYNNPKRNNYKGARTAQRSRVCMSDEAELWVLHDQDTGVKYTGRFRGPEADNGPVCKNSESIC